MARRLDLILRGGMVAMPAGLVRTDIGVLNGRVAEFGDFGSADAEAHVDRRGLHILPGVIDPRSTSASPAGI